MDCPSNPRGLAYKRNYRSSSALILLTFFATLNSATAFNAKSPNTFLANNNNNKIPNPHSRLDLTPSHTLPQESSQESRVGASIQSDVHFDRPSSKLDLAFGFAADRAPGVALSVALAQLSIAVGKTSMGSHVSPLLWATIFGMAYGNLLHNKSSVSKKSLATGIKFAKGRLLRLGIILYGFKITFQQIANIGMAGVMTDLVMVSSTLALGITLGTKVFKLDEATSTLIASGAAICGCSAVLATQPVVGGESHQVSAAVGTVVLGGTLSMFLYPLLYKMVPFLAASPKLMAIYTGSTIHEIAGVVAAGNAMGGDVACTAVVTKLARVLLLAPVLTTLSWIQNRKYLKEAKAAGVQVASNNSKVVLPWFVFGFVAVSAVNSVITFPTALVHMAGKTSAFALVCAMAALGIDSNFQEIRKLGSKPLLLAATLWGWLAIGGLGVARLFVGA